MSNYDYTHEPNKVISLRSWALAQMSWGALVAAFWVTVVIVWLGIAYVIGMLMPEQSKQAPSPYAAVEVVKTSDFA